MNEIPGQLDLWRRLFSERAESLFSSRREIPGKLREAMSYAMMAGGKRLRPLLVLSSCRAAGGTDERALPAALAVEMIHTYSLIHDDLPAMDDDDLRRGRPTTHVIFGEAMAILAGDALHTMAFETLAGANLPAARIRAQVATLARAAGPGGMAGGQVLDLLAEGQEPSEELVSHIDRLKTGALLAASHRLGAEAAGGETSLLERLEEVGERVGLAFQMQDDILDQTATSEQLGKTPGKDQAAGKVTWPAVVGIEETGRRARMLVQQALDLLEPLGPRAAALRHLTRLAVERHN